MSGATTLDQVIQTFIENAITELRVCMPGRIESYDPETHLANIEPTLLRRYYARENPTSLPVINKVPVIHPRTSNALIRLPVQTGDPVVLVFADRSIENWLQGDGGPREPLDEHKHHYNDAFAILGGWVPSSPWAARNPNALEIEVKSGTKITIGNETDDLLQLAHDAFTSLKEATEQLSQTLTDIQQITVVAPGGGGTTTTPLNAAAFASIKTLVDQITSDVNTTISSLGNIKV